MINGHILITVRIKLFHHIYNYQDYIKFYNLTLNLKIKLKSKFIKLKFNFKMAQ
jgi:hypothetical protein